MPGGALTPAPHGEEARSAVTNHEADGPSFETAAFETAARRGLLKMRPEQDDFASTRRPRGCRDPHVSAAHRDAVSFHWATWKTPSLLAALSTMSALPPEADMG